MKKTSIACLVLAVILVMTMMASAAGIFSIKTSLSPGDPIKSLTIPATSGETLEISAYDMERRLELESGTLKGVTFISVPDGSDGAFFIDGVEVEAFDYLSRAELDKLCFVHSEDTLTVSSAFVPDTENAAATSLNIQVLQSSNHPPVIEGASYDTMKNVRLNGFLNVNDPEEDSVSIRVVQKPAKGDVSFNGQSFVYEPYTNMIGSDHFTVCAIDSRGNFSSDASVEILIESTRAVFSYADMKTHPSNYAALKLQEKGVMTGRQIGGDWYFNPEDMVTRGDFLIMLLAAADMDTKPTVNTGLPNDTNIPYWLKPYVKKAIDENIISAQQAFNYKEIPIRAEAVLMIDRSSKITDVKQFALTMGDAAEIPDWAIASYTDLAAYKMLDLHNGLAYPNSALTNSYAADLVWQLYKHCHR